ncbi:rRNA pseudouridine synthase [Rhodanobacter sp. A1T4]|uniref:rRNA pseudouridine synthase n=1 Tax=Rhodanobacter sp. A1T4 TaxID=2723087 RepID=UPI001618292A|nr:rRNA pseudouridine synthase [Rhodanobacter sp. A1T4]MBB6247964.1 23S rRNA pseudouridine2604 synthase [Rhodanobacter sp. A1T4]
MTDPVRLAKRVVALAQCSRREAEQYIEGGWVRVDGVVVEKPQFMVDTQTVELDPGAQLIATEPATLVLHKPAGYDSGNGPNPASALVTPDTRSPDDASGVRPLKRHLQRLTSPLPLSTEATGLMIFTQDWRVTRKLTEDIDRVEQEFVVDVSGELIANGLALLNHGLRFNNYAMPPIKVSWQSEQRLRFAFKVLQPSQIEPMCHAVGLKVLAMKRLRIGRISLAKLPLGQWRYLAPHERI